MNVIEKINWMLGQSSDDEFVNRPLETYNYINNRYNRNPLEIYGFVKDLQGAFLVKSQSGKTGYKIKSNLETCI